MAVADELRICTVLSVEPVHARKKKRGGRGVHLRRQLDDADVDLLDYLSAVTTVRLYGVVELRQQHSRPRLHEHATQNGFFEVNALTTALQDGCGAGCAQRQARSSGQRDSPGAAPARLLANRGRAFGGRRRILGFTHLYGH